MIITKLNKSEIQEIAKKYNIQTKPRGYWAKVRARAI